MLKPDGYFVGKVHFGRDTSRPYIEGSRKWRRDVVHMTVDMRVYSFQFLVISFMNFSDWNRGNELEQGVFAPDAQRRFH